MPQLKFFRNALDSTNTAIQIQIKLSGYYPNSDSFSNFW